jgi:hypothetical protein
MTRVLRFGAIVLVAVVLATCSSDEKLPTGQAGPGWLALRLSTQAADAGGVLLSVRGGAVDSVRSAFPHVFEKRVGPLTKIVVAGDLSNGVIAEIFVPDAGASASYTVTVDQAAARTLQQRDPADYDVTVEPQ